MCLEGEKHNLSLAYRFHIVRGLWASVELSARASHGHTPILHGAKVRAASNEDHVLAASGEVCAEQAADRARSHDGHPHSVISG
jgi:hypothetical protein